MSAHAKQAYTYHDLLFALVACSLASSFAITRARIGTVAFAFFHSSTNHLFLFISCPAVHGRPSVAIGHQILLRSRTIVAFLRRAALQVFCNRFRAGRASLAGLEDGEVLRIFVSGQTGVSKLLDQPDGELTTLWHTA